MLHNPSHLHMHVRSAHLIPMCMLDNISSAISMCYAILDASFSYVLHHPSSAIDLHVRTCSAPMLQISTLLAPILLHAGDILSHLQSNPSPTVCCNSLQPTIGSQVNIRLLASTFDSQHQHSTLNINIRLSESTFDSQHEHSASTFDS
ncbi:hypothetical protein SLEP1_g60501 [Rubroshorea leprosula]|uniref:Uncharacterized protein n=1 Tax=Rubroshorea leprosula TaxID=152421 RepID=A0AAV5MVG3_9ROSI|nr:hypothetical protein SLEP1_g60501 [Rubroshorea leprosula]